MRLRVAMTMGSSFQIVTSARGEVAAAEVAVAAAFEEFAVVLAGGSAGGFGDDVVDVAAVDRVAVAGGVLTVAVAYFDGAAQ